VVEPGAKLGDLGIVVICRQRREVEVVVDVQHAGPGSLCDRLHAGPYARQQRFKELGRPGRQRQTCIAPRRLGLPSPGRQE
jgi:hypothetical protein